VRRVYTVLSRVGLRPQTAKTAMIPPGARKVVLGLLIDADRVRLTREFRRRLECQVHHIAWHGHDAHARRRGFRSVLGLRRHLAGQLSYAATVDRDFSSELCQKLAGVIRPV
jgi:RNA-directed DNA polymerase